MATSDRSRARAKGASAASGVAGAALALVSLFVFSYYPQERAVLWVAATASAAALAFFAVCERRRLAALPQSRAARYGANTAAMTLAFVGILVLVNVLAVRHDQKWDATANRLFTLSDQTRKVLAALKKDVTVTAFYSDGPREREARDEMKRLLDSYKDESTRLKVTFVDPDKRPEVAQQYGLRQYGTTVFASGAQSFRITQATEEAVTNALVRVTREGKKSVFFLTGHGEHASDDTQRGGYSGMRKLLEGQGYEVKDLLLLREAEVPKDCDVLVVAGPTKPLVGSEVRAVGEYLARGGRGLFMIDPLTSPGLDPVLEAWGAELHDDIIVDPMSRLFGGSYTTPVITEYPPHEITKDFTVPSFLPFARSIDRAQVLPKGVTFAPIAKTSPQSWGETNLKDERASFDPSRDVKGPLTVAAIFEKREVFDQEDDKPGGQLLLIGDSDFPANSYMNFSGNGDLFQNMVSYLAKEEDLISIRPKDLKSTPLMLTRAQAAILLYGGVVIVPVLLAVTGVTIWWKRRHL